MDKNKDLFGKRIKQYEEIAEYCVPQNEHIVVRIDGHKFSKYTKGFDRPFDKLLSDTMIATVKELLPRFNAVVGYTQSDEITLIIPSNYTDERNNQIFAGRTQKMSSLIASFTTMTFNKIFNQLKPDFIKYEDKVGKAWFDCRVFGVPSDIEAFNSILWRVHDCTKNSYSQFAYAYCSHKSLLNKTGQEMISFCKETTGNDWNDIEDKYKYGTFVKKQQWLKKGDGVTTKDSIRTKLIEVSKSLTYSEENVNFVMCKSLSVYTRTD